MVEPKITLPRTRKSLIQVLPRNGTPVYKRIQTAIRARIESLELQPGDPVPSERELAKIHKVSLMTARHALAGLEREGLVERRRGAGTFVAAPKIHFNKLMSYTEHMSSRGLSPRSRVLVAKIVEHDAEVAARLALPATTSLVKIERLRETGELTWSDLDSLVSRKFLRTIPGVHPCDGFFAAIIERC